MKTTLGVVLLSFVVAAPAFAKHPHKDNRRCYLESRDVVIVREYYAPRARALPPGLAKKYERTGQLPPGWIKKIEPLPVEVERRMVVLPPEYRRGYIDGAVVVYSPKTHVAIDIAAVF
jgi:hypothetical protein